MSFYLDTSFVATFMFGEPLAQKAQAFWKETSGASIISNLAALEFSSAVSRRLRMNAFSIDDADRLLGYFDALRQTCLDHIIAEPDFRLALSLVRDFGLKLSTADALHLAATIGLNATLVTLDERLAAAARLRNVKVAPD